MFYSVLSASLFVPVVAGLFLPRAARTHARAAMLAGAVTTTGLHLATAGAGYAGFAPVVWGLLASATALGAALAWKVGPADGR